MTGFRLKRLARKSRENQLKALPRISVSDATPPFLFLPHLTLLFFFAFVMIVNYFWKSFRGREIIATVFFPGKISHETGLLQPISGEQWDFVLVSPTFFPLWQLKVGGRFLSRRVSKVSKREWIENVEKYIHGIIFHENNRNRRLKVKALWFLILIIIYDSWKK